MVDQSRVIVVLCARRRSISPLIISPFVLDILQVVAEGFMLAARTPLELYLLPTSLLLQRLNLHRQRTHLMCVLLRSLFKLLLTFL